jgi:hypothetical protein
MAHLIEITLLTPHCVLGSLQAKGARCEIHQGVADDLIKRKIATKAKTPHKNEPTRAESKREGGK